MDDRVRSKIEDYLDRIKDELNDAEEYEVDLADKFTEYFSEDRSRLKEIESEIRDHLKDLKMNINELGSFESIESDIQEIEDLRGEENDIRKKMKIVEEFIDFVKSE